jgi:hypothetical protein
LYYLTLSPASTISPAPQEGDCFGDLRLFFTALNSDDYTPTPSPGVWTAGSIEPPSDMYPRFLVAGPIPGMNPTGQGTGGFLPNAPRATKWFGEVSNQNDQLSWTTGFVLDVPWTGVSANCSGMWRLKWKQT